MSRPSPQLRLVAAPRSVLPAPADVAARSPLGRLLLEAGAVDPAHLVRALAMGERAEATLGDILIAQGWVREEHLYAALSRQWAARPIDPLATPPDPRLIDRLGARRCLSALILPLVSVGGAVIVATARPESFRRLVPGLERDLGQPVTMAIAPPSAIVAALEGCRSGALRLAAECRVAEAESCRAMASPRVVTRTLSVLALMATAAIAAPHAVFLALFLWAVLTLLVSTGIKLAAVIAQRHARRDARAEAALRLAGGTTTIARMPVVSVMVPLLREPDIAERLVRRIGRVDYPRELLDIVLVVEAGDLLTQAALARAGLPAWMRIVAVPDGPLKTKPRALNYALDHCRGSIIGVWDAEDAPEPDQIGRIVQRFHERGPQVACLQGVLDYYNPDTNWLSRCFTIEYAAWFRIVLPGLARMGMVVPLGGTTLFFRRKALEALGGWDAHNVTEDADLGLRLARHGFRTELIDTVTEEEPNCRALPWVRQRSRWLKGYAITYAVHMRHPRLLLGDLGWRGFLGVQAMFLCNLSNYLLQPVLWSFWLICFGLPHPLEQALPLLALKGLGLLFVLSEAVNIAVGIIAVSGPRHRFLIPWVPTLHLYFPLGALAAWKAFYEVIARPFYWDKTAHGIIDGPQATAARPDEVDGTLSAS